MLCPLLHTDSHEVPDEQESWGSSLGCWRGDPDLGSLSRQGLQTGAQGREWGAEQAKPLLPSTWAWTRRVITSRRRATGIHRGGSSLLGPGMGLGWSASSLGVSSPHAPATNSLQGVSRLPHRAGNTDCQAKEEAAGRSCIPPTPYSKQPASIDGRLGTERDQSNSRPNEINA